MLMHTEGEVCCQRCRYMQYFLILRKNNPWPHLLFISFFLLSLPNTPYPFYIRFEWFGLCLRALSKRRWSGSVCLWQNEAVCACQPPVFHPSRCQINVQSAISHYHLLWILCGKILIGRWDKEMWGAGSRLVLRFCSEWRVTTSPLGFIWVSNASRLSCSCSCLSKTGLRASNHPLKWKLFMVWMVPKLVGSVWRRPMFFMIHCWLRGVSGFHSHH